MRTLSKLPMHLRAAYLAMHRQTSARLTELEITTDQFVCLLILFRSDDGLIQRELVERATSDQNTISAILALLEKKGCVVRKAHTDDRRARIVSLTAKGRRIVKQAIKALAPLHAGIRTVLSADESQTLITLLGKLAGHLV